MQALASKQPGWGCLSGQIMPLMQNCRPGGSKVAAHAASRCTFTQRWLPGSSMLVSGLTRAAAAPHASSGILSGHAAPSHAELITQRQLWPVTKLRHANSYPGNCYLTEQLTQAVTMIWCSAS